MKKIWRRPLWIVIFLILLLGAMFLGAFALEWVGLPNFITGTEAEDTRKDILRGGGDEPVREQVGLIEETGIPNLEEAFQKEGGIFIGETVAMEDSRFRLTLVGIARGKDLLRPFGNDRTLIDDPSKLYMVLSADIELGWGLIADVRDAVDLTPWEYRVSILFSGHDACFESYQALFEPRQAQTVIRSQAYCVVECSSIGDFAQTNISVAVWFGDPYYYTQLGRRNAPDVVDPYYGNAYEGYQSEDQEYANQIFHENTAEGTFEFLYEYASFLFPNAVFKLPLDPAQGNPEAVQAVINASYARRYEAWYPTLFAEDQYKKQGGANYPGTEHFIPAGKYEEFLGRVPDAVKQEVKAKYERGELASDQ